MTAANLKISAKAFDGFRKLIYEQAGITLSPLKQSLVEGRLSKRLRHYDIQSYDEYFHMVTGQSSDSELQIVIDLLTTNETYFFRESQHFEFLEKNILPNVRTGRPFRIWSAASSTGQEAYSIAMLLADKIQLSGNWQITGTDINSQVLDDARLGLYPMEQALKIPDNYLRKYVLKGVREQTGKMLMDKKLKAHVLFESLNLIGNWPNHLKDFDVVFLRNVMIYFDEETKSTLVNKIAQRIKSGGYLFVGHAESLHGMCNEVSLIQPSIYQKE